MSREQELNVKIEHVSSKINEITSRLKDHDNKVVAMQEAIWKIEVEMDLAKQLNYPPAEKTKLSQQRDNYEIKLAELKQKSFPEDDNALLILNKIHEDLTYERDGFDFEAANL